MIIEYLKGIESKYDSYALCKVLTLIVSDLKREVEDLPESEKDYIRTNLKIVDKGDFRYNEYGGEYKEIVFTFGNDTLYKIDIEVDSYGILYGCPRDLNQIIYEVYPTDVIKTEYHKVEK